MQIQRRLTVSITLTEPLDGGWPIMDPVRVVVLRELIRNGVKLRTCENYLRVQCQRKSLFWGAEYAFWWDGTTDAKARIHFTTENVDKMVDKMIVDEGGSFTIEGRDNAIEETIAFLLLTMPAWIHAKNREL